MFIFLKTCLFISREEFEQQIVNFKNAIYKGFNDKYDAYEYMITVVEQSNFDNTVFKVKKFK